MIPKWTDRHESKQFFVVSTPPEVRRSAKNKYEEIKKKNSSTAKSLSRYNKKGIK